MLDSDRQIVAEIIGGQVHRFADVVRKYDARVRWAIGRQVPNADLRDDLVQETFYRAFKNLDQCAERESLEGWLVVIARNCVADHFRRRKLADHRQEFAIVEQAAVEVGSDWVWEELNHLPLAHAEILRMRYRDACSYEELAKQLRIPISTVRGRIYEARRALRRRLEEKGLMP